MYKEMPIKDHKIVKPQNLHKLTSVSVVTTLIDSRVDDLFESVRNKYRIDEEELYDRLYLKVRKMFIEEEN